MITIQLELVSTPINIWFPPVLSVEKTSHRKNMKNVWTVIIMISHPLRVFSNLSVNAPGGFKEELQEIQWSLGLEYTYHEQFSIRGGYHWEHENKGNRKYFSFGAGFKMSVFSLDAAYLVSNSTEQSTRPDTSLHVRFRP